LGALPPEQVGQAMAKPDAAAARPTKDFRDLDPDKPLKWAVYSEDYARSLIEETGWKALSLSPPDVNQYIQHHFICAPS
jgi:hypothetical protein